MPALVLFGRRWLVAGDDFVIPSALEAVARAAGSVCGAAVTWHDATRCASDPFVLGWLAAVSGYLAATCILALLLALISARGAVFEVERRRHLSKLLYVKFASAWMDAGGAAVGVWMLSSDAYAPVLCPVTSISILVGTVCGWLCVLGYAAGVALCYNSLGGSGDSGSKSKEVWSFRLKILCCWTCCRDESETTPVELASPLAALFGKVDLVPSDVLAGLVALGGKHAVKSRRQPRTGAQMLSGEPDWMTAENALYFLRMAKSTYGWFAFLDLCNPCSLCALLPHLRDGGCTRAAVRRIAGLGDGDEDLELVHLTLGSSVHEPGFLVALDHRARALVVAVRGTVTPADLLTDLDVPSEPWPDEDEGTPFLCHRGVLRSAQWLRARLDALGLLAAMPQGYAPVLTGHSLGGSVAAALALLLRPRHPALRCYAFGPAAALSEAGVGRTLDCVFSVVAGDDMVARMCFRACAELGTEMMDVLRITRVPKHKLLTQAVWTGAKKFLGCRTRSDVSEGHYNVNFQIGDENPDASSPPAQPKADKLFAPGRILYLERRNGCTGAYWLTGVDLDGIIVSPRMLADHQPSFIQKMLERHRKAVGTPQHP